MRKTWFAIVAGISSLVPIASSPAIAANRTDNPIMFMPVLASTTANQGIISFCKGDLPNFPTEHLGNCVAIQSTSARGADGGTVANVCLFFQNVAPDFFDLFYRSIGECVADNANFGG